MLPIIIFLCVCTCMCVHMHVYKTYAVYVYIHTCECVHMRQQVKCIHDELFEVTGYHPAGAEHVSLVCIHVWLVVGCDML